MKNILQRILLCSVVFVLLTTQGRSQSILIHYWDFNNLHSVQYTDTIHAVSADYSRISARTASILYAEIPGTSSAFSTYLDGVSVSAISPDYDTINLRQTDTAGIALRTRNPTDSMQLLFYIPTTNYKNIVLTYGTESSSLGSGPTHQIYDYSLDSGATWKTSGLSITTDSAGLSFTRASVNFFGDTLVNNNSQLIFRIKFSGNTNLTSGNNRFDNVTIDADTSTAATIYVSPTSIGTIATSNDATYTLYPNPVTGHINIVSPSEENKTILIYNTAGQTVYMSLEGGKQLSITTSNLNAGNYYIIIHGNSSKTTQTLRFVKQ